MLLTDEQKRERDLSAPNTTQVSPTPRPYKVGNGVLTSFDNLTTPTQSTQRDKLSALDLLRLQHAEQNIDAKQAARKATAAAEDYAAKREAYNSDYRAAVDLMSPAKQERFSPDNVQREKRKAIATALGDLLSSIAGGAMAASGVGYGYTPTVRPNQSLAKLSALEKDYLATDKEYRSILSKINLDERKADMVAAGERAKQAVREVEAANKNKAKTYNELVKEQGKIDAHSRAVKKQEEGIVMRGEQTRETNAQKAKQTKDRDNLRHTNNKDLSTHKADNQIRVNAAKPAKDSSKSSNSLDLRSGAATPTSPASAPSPTPNRRVVVDVPAAAATPKKRSKKEILDEINS